MPRFDFERYKDKQFGCLHVFDYSHYDKQRKLNFVKAKCLNCGSIITISSNRLNLSHTYCAKCVQRPHITLNKRLRRIYGNMKNRCNNKKSNRFHRYGARGIKVCEEWAKSFANFQNWALNNGYEDHLTLDRINNDGDYEPKNCRWATYKEQSHNSSANRGITINGETKTITEWCEHYDIPYYVINNRINKYNWDYITAFTVPIRKAKTFTFLGENLTINQISKKTKIPKYALYRHLYRQKDFTPEIWQKLDTFYKKHMGE